jgi:hypothetical protein
MQNQTTIADERAAEAAEAAAIYAPHPVPTERDEAARLLAEILKPNAPVYLLTTKESQLILGMTGNALPIMRMKGKGPKFQKMTNFMIRYRSDDLVAWLKSTERTSTSDTGAN